jgi:hypothetical protein
VPVGLANLVGDCRLDIPVFTRRPLRLRIHVLRGNGSGTFVEPPASVRDTPASDFVPERTVPM